MRQLELTSCDYISGGTEHQATQNRSQHWLISEAAQFTQSAFYATCFMAGLAAGVYVGSHYYFNIPRKK